MPAHPEPSQARAVAAAGPEETHARSHHAVWLMLLLAAYFGLQVTVRTLMSSSVDLDESEQVVLGQEFCWGYGSDPPLYTWIQIPFFGVFGESVLTLSLLKNLLLFSVYGLTFMTARIVTRSHTGAIAATLSLLYLPSVAWESQRDLTHTILASSLAVGTLLCLLKLCATRRTRWYVVFGLSAGLGLISKYNYALWLAGLVLGVLSLPQQRPALLDKRVLLSVALMTILFLPNGLWVLQHRDLALLTSSKFEIARAPGWWAVVGTGLKNILQSLAAFAAPMTLIYLLLFLIPGKHPPAGRGPERDYQQVIVRAWLAIGLVLLLLVLCARATGFKERWFQPLLICLPVLAVSLVQQRLEGLRLKWIVATSLLVMVAVLVVMPGRLVAAERLNREEPLTRPYSELAARIRQTIPDNALVVCDTRLLAGNLRLGLPQGRVLPTELVPLMGGGRTHCVIVWDARRDDAPPEHLRKWAERFGSGTIKDRSQQYFAARYQHHETKQYRLGLMQLR